jgi:hypothetical protein
MILNIVIGCILGIIYYLLICQMSKYLYIDTDSDQELNIQHMILFMFLGGLIALFIGYHLKTNSSIQFGLFIGSFMLYFNSLVINWNNMDNHRKIILLSITFGLLIWYTCVKYY